jgi:hypothetical protein
MEDKMINRNSPEWEQYRIEQNKIAREAGRRKVIQGFNGTGISGNALVNELRIMRIPVPRNIQKILDHDDTIISISNITTRGLSKSEARMIGKWATSLNI